MANQVSTLVAAPTFSGDVSTDVQLEPLQGGDRSEVWLDNFPDTIYSQSDTSLLYQFLYTLLGPTGVGFFRDNMMQARLIYEQANMNTSQVEDFYGNPFGFARSVTEFPEGDTDGLLTQDQLATIESQNASYQNRAIDFLNGVRFGNNPRGLKLIAKSGLGQTCEVIENYKYFYDQKSDNPIGLPYYGKTTSTEELIVVANNEVSNTQVQTIEIGSDVPTVVATLSSTASTNTGTYYWVVEGVDALGNKTIPSNEVSMVVSSHAILLTWQPIQNAVKYNVYRSTTSGGESTPGSNSLVATTTATNYTDTISATTSGHALDQVFYLYFNGNYVPQETGVANAWAPSASVSFSLNPNYAVVATAVTNINITAPGTSTFNGVTVNSGQIVRLINQTNSSQNGYYTFNGPSSAMILATQVFADQFTVQSQLQDLTGVGANVTVSGGPSIVSGSLIYEPYTITFTNVLSNQSLNEIQIKNSTQIGAINFTNLSFIISSSIGSISGQEIIGISPVDFHNLQQAMDRIKPVTMLPTVHPFTSVWNRQAWQNIYSTTQRTPVIQYVTGQSDINWPVTDNFHWIVGGVETEAPRLESDIQHDYENFHPAATITASSTKIGPYNQLTQQLYPNLTAPTLQYEFIAANATNNGLNQWYMTKVGIDSTTGKPVGLIGGTYPYDYITLTGVTPPGANSTWWSSQEALGGVESLIIDLGTKQAINYIDFETTAKSYSVEIQYDIANQTGITNYYPVVINSEYNYSDIIAPQSNLSVPWQQLSFYFNNGVDPVIFTRYVKLIFTRGLAPTSYGDTFGWSIDIKSLRIGRIVG